MKALFLLRKVSTSNGSCYLQPIGIFADEHLAKQAAEEANGFINEMSAGKVVLNTPQGPRGVMTVSQLLAEIGVAGIEILTMSGEVKETGLVMPRNLVALQ